jgi:hypothetical protein
MSRSAPVLVPIMGVRMIRVSEPAAPVKWAEGRIKQLTEGEPREVRVLRCDFVEATAAASLFRRVYLRLLSVLSPWLWRVPVIGESEKADRGGQVRLFARCCRKGSDQ